MVHDFHAVKFYDEEIWNMLLTDLSQKKKIDNLHFLSVIF